MKKNAVKNTQRRIIYLVSALALLMFAGLYYFRNLEESRITLMMADEETENTHFLENIINFSSSGLNNFVNDYTYWDDMVNFSEKPDTAWAKANIQASMQTFGANFAWILNKDTVPVFYIASDSTINIDSVFITKEMIHRLTSDSRFFHFFIQINSKVIEISGATIHPTDDPERLSEPRGYFIAGKLWSENHLRKLSGLTATEIELSGFYEKDSSVIKETKGEFWIKSIVILYSWDTKPLIYLTSSREVTIVKIMHDQSDWHFVVMLIAVVSILILVAASLYFLVNLPLKNISRSMRENDPRYISKLLNKHNEYGEMAKMLNNFFIQKEKLMNEIEERIEAEYKIQLSEEKLKHTLNEKVVLLKEVHHRVKNNLQIIASLIRLQTENLDNKKTIAHLQATLNRIKSIAFVHEMLYRTGNLSNIDFNRYVTVVTHSLKDIYSSEAKDVKLHIDVNEIFLPVDKAIPCGIIINELVTNSIKHAFNGSAAGTIYISMSKVDNEYILKVKDDGIGIRKNMKINETKSLGMYLITSLAEQIDARINIENNNGTVFTLSFNDNG